MRRGSGRGRVRRRGGRLWPLLGLAAAGVAVAFWLQRRRAFEGPAEEDLLPEPERPLPPAAPDTPVWIAGPAGNLYVRDGGEGPGVPVLFLHSLGGNGGQWAPQLDHLRHDRRAVALDLRGHGESDPAEDVDYSIAGFATDVAAAADQLDLRRFVLAGHSLGASVAIEYAGRHPERVAGLFLVDPNGDQTRVPAGEMASFLEALRADPAGEMEWYFKQLLVQGDRAASDWVLEDLRATHEDALVGAVENAARHSPLPALERYRGPKLAVLSDMNDLPYSLHRLVPDLPVRLIPGTGHWLQLDRPDLVNRILGELLDDVDRRAG